MDRFTATDFTNSDLVLMAIHGRQLQRYYDVRLYPRSVGPPGSCLVNAIHTAQRSIDDLTVVAGYAGDNPAWAHAWLVDNRGIAWECTWRQVWRNYRGVPLSPADLERLRLMPF